jgi:hypothetical protein
MKLLKLIVALLMLTVTSCQVEDDSIQESGTEIQEANTRGFLSDDTPLQEPWASWDHEGFEHMMEGVGQVVTKVILDDFKAEAQFRNVMLANNNVVTLEDLLGPSVQPRHFAVAFEREYNALWSTTDNGFCPDGFDPIPFPNGRSSGYTAYLYNILEEHCLELYMPVNYNRALDKVHFASHPLNTSSWNEGYLAFRDSESIWCITPRTIHDSHLDGGIGSSPTVYDNLIIVRPITPDLVTGNGVYCAYTVYDSLDFSLFFD